MGGSLHPTQFSFDAAIRSLRTGGVLLMDTDTLPGLHCRADDPVAAARIVAAKRRPDDKPLLVLAGSTGQAHAVCGPLTGAQLAACRRCWPGPFSLILPAGPGIAAEVLAGHETLAIRVPQPPQLRDLILAVGVPLVSTSANRSGQAPIEELTAAVDEFDPEIDGSWCLDPPGVEVLPQSGAGPSTLVDLTVTPFRVLRQGPARFPTT